MAETAQEAARRLAAPWIAKGYRPKALHAYRDAQGAPLFYRMRLEHPDGDSAPDGRKVIRPLYLNGAGFIFGEPKFSGKKPLYGLDLVAKHPAARVWIVEGEKAADALASLGAVVVTSGGVDSAERADWSPIGNRDVAIWPDNDEAGQVYAGAVGGLLRALKCRVSVVRVESLGLPPKGDAADWLAAREIVTLDELEALPLLQAKTPADETPISEAVVFMSRRLSDIEAKPIRWLWPGRIARGKVSMIAGHPGLGKSQLTAAIASVVTNGGRWPVDGTPCERGSVIFLNAEDDAADTIRPRLEATGADLTRCEMLDAVVDGYGPDGKPLPRSFNLKADLRILRAMLEQRPDVALVVIDPITAYLSGVETHVNADVRAVLAPLGELAAERGVAIVCVSHLNKAGMGRGAPGDALMRVSGSLAFVAAARAAYVVVRDPENEARRLFLAAKNNIGKDDTGLAFIVESFNLPEGIETSRVMWEAQPVSISADEAMAAPPEEGERSMTDEAVDLLNDMLEPGRVLAKEVKRHATDLGISEKALRIARERLHVRATREGFGSDMKSYWYLGVPPVVPSTPHSCPAN